jgi:hypothetical protein
MDYQEFDLFLSNIFYKSENKVLSKDTSNNTKRLLKSFTKEKRTLHNRVAKIGDTIYYDLCDELWKCVKITKEGWEVIPNPGIFRRISQDRSQVFPIWTGNRRYFFETHLTASDLRRMRYIIQGHTAECPFYLLIVAADSDRVQFKYS